MQTITPHNGQITFSATLPVPTPPSADVMLHIQQPLGVEILTFNFGTIDP